MKVVVKLGGTLLEDDATRNALARELAAASRENEVVAVHGGGKQVTKFLEERGISSRFSGGLRVSDEAVMDAVTKVIAGGVNKQLVSAIIQAGEAAVGLSGIDGLLTLAEQFDPALGFVGRPVRTDGHLLELLVNAGYLPVIACVAADRSGRPYNVNADQMAVSCAAGFGAHKLIFLTDVDGVRGGDGRVLPLLNRRQMGDLIQSGVAHGGMQAKLQAAETALQSGLSEVDVAQGREPRICERLLAGERIGTRLVAERGERGPES